MSAAPVILKRRALPEAVLTAAAFFLVIAMVLGLGPFGGSQTAHRKAPHERLSAEPTTSPRFAALP